MYCIRIWSHRIALKWNLVVPNIGGRCQRLNRMNWDKRRHKRKHRLHGRTIPKYIRLKRPLKTKIQEHIQYVQMYNDCNRKSTPIWSYDIKIKTVQVFVDSVLFLAYVHDMSRTLVFIVITKNKVLDIMHG